MIQQIDIQGSRSRWLIAGRLFVAFVFFTGALYNICITLRNPVTELCRLIDLSPLEFIRKLADSIAIPHAAALIIMIIFFELSVTVSVFLPIKIRRYAYIASLVFFAALAPLIGWYALSNLVWALPVLMLLRCDKT